MSKHSIHSTVCSQEQSTTKIVIAEQCINVHWKILRIYLLAKSTLLGQFCADMAKTETETVLMTASQKLTIFPTRERQCHFWPLCPRKT